MLVYPQTKGMNKRETGRRKKTGIPAMRVLLQCAPAAIADVHAIVEACDNLAVVRTLEPEMAVVELIATPDTFADTLEVAKGLERMVGARILHPRR